MVLCHLHAERSFRQVWCDLILDNSIKLFQPRPSEGQGPVKALASDSTLEVTSVAYPPTAPLLQCAVGSLVAAAYAVFLLGGKDAPAVSLCDLFSVISKGTSSSILPQNFSQCLEMYYCFFGVALFFFFLVSPTANFFQSPSYMPHNFLSVLSTLFQL